MLCGYSLSEYIKRRRLTLAGSEVLSTNGKIIDIALNVPLKIKFSLEGGYIMDYKIVEKDEFKE